ncbi:NAD(P)-binding protein [Bartonella sp. DGB2]|uniref:NAD(P)-binding protein n=1 Tax=Bartonella sp. DGB2 TaxID=3388426 RepID=UPI00399015F8
MSISRRDFLNGVALAVIAGLTPLEQIRADPVLGEKALYYPPALTGLRGTHPGAFESAHALGRAGRYFDYASLSSEEDYDLIIVGAGISGLSAAWLYRKALGPNKRILLLDNHDDFGGHAKRNEFQTEDGLILAYGGSESLQSPKSIYSKNALSILSDLGVDIDVLASHFDVDFYPGRGMSRATFFDRKNFGMDKVVTGDPSRIPSDDVPPSKLNARSYRDFVSDFPLNKDDREKIIKLFEGGVDYLAGLTKSEKENYLNTHSYQQFLLEKVKLGPMGVRYFQQKTSDFDSISIDGLSAMDGYESGLLGFDAMGLDPRDPDSQADLDDPYIFHFPDGNASLTRLLVRKLIPSVAEGTGMDDIVLAKFDYSQLDRAENNTRLRLNSICVHAENTDNGKVEVTYIHHNKDLKKISANKVIMAGYNMMIPSIVPSLPEQQKAILHKNVKSPLVYTKVAIKNWHAFDKLGVHYFYCATAPYCVVKLDYPVSMGGYHHPSSPDQPIGLHMIQVPTFAGSGIDAAEQARLGRAQILGKSFAAYEEEIRAQLQDMLGDAGFDHQKDIVAITVNRWPHGYSADVSVLSDDEDEAEALADIGRAPHGNIHIANSDSGWDPYAHIAMDQAKRAVDEILSS